MKAIISTTYSDTYLYFLPITTFLWNKLGVDVVCFMPSGNSKIERSGGFIQGVFPDGNKRMYLINETIKKNNGNLSIHFFKSPEHKEATYAQCSRLYGACLDLPEDEVLVIGDVDMAMFQLPKYNSGFTITGFDLVPSGQYPMCYVSAKVKDWRDAFGLNGITYQTALDRILGDDECQDYRACRWSVDQEQLHKNINLNQEINVIPRTNGQNQFAQNRIDRDDTYWRDRLNLDIMDAHLWRDGYTEQNHNNIIELLTYMYPQENFEWLVIYRNSYVNLL